jgi:ribosomal protein L44E
MSFKHVATTADLVRYRASLRIECTACGSANTMTAVQLAKRCGNRELGKLAKRLKCARCGVKAAHIVVLPPV